MNIEKKRNIETTQTTVIVLTAEDIVSMLAERQKRLFSGASKVEAVRGEEGGPVLTVTVRATSRREK